MAMINSAIHGDLERGLVFMRAAESTMQLMAMVRRMCWASVSAFHQFSQYADFCQSRAKIRFIAYFTCFYYTVCNIVIR